MVSPLLHCLLPLALLCSCFIGSPLQTAYCGNVFADVLAPREDTINGGSGSSEAQLVAQFQDQGDEEEAEYYQALSESGGLPILSINSCTLEQLREHPLIRPQEAQAIINYRNAYGELSSLHELAYIEGLSPGRIKLLTHLFSLSPSPSSLFSQGFRPQTLEVAQRTLYRLPLGPRYEPKYRSDSTRPLGDPLGLQVRALYKAKDWLKVAFKGTKSPFEPFFRHFNPQGFSSYSGFIQLDLPRVRVERVVAGCYNYRVGHGLLMQSQGLIFPVYDPYSSGRLSVLPQGSLRYPGSSTLMGMGASLRIFEHLRLTAALSVKRLNSRLKHDSIETLSISPTITTLSQAKHRRTTWEAMAIADLQYTIKNLTGGVAFRTLHYSHPFRVADPKRKIAKPSYLQNSQALSAYFAWYGGAVDFYGEILAQVDPSARVPFSWGKGSGLLGVNARLPYSFSITMQAFSFGRENNPIYQ